MTMRLPKILITIICILTFSLGKTYAQTYDFEMVNDTNILYTTGEDFVSVVTTFVRKVNNKSYFFSTTGEKIFHIPDSNNMEDEKVKEERSYKIDSISVTDSNSNPVQYTIEELDIGQGIYVKVPNFKETSYTSPYTVNLKYKTHIYVKNTKGWVSIQIPALHKDTQFTQTDENTKTSSLISYNLNVQVDSNIPPLAKIYPSQYNVTSNDGKTTYSFNGLDRVDVPIYMEFGTKRVFKFETKLITPKTDSFIPKEYSENLGFLSTNIYLVPLPREYEENKQSVKIEKILPNPTKITIDLEGNVYGTFEVPANEDSEIYISGYIWVEQDTLESKSPLPDISYTDYKKSVSKDTTLSQYLLPTNYWQSTDQYILSKALELSNGKERLIDVIKSNYTYINDVLEYDYAKANSDNLRIGAKAALQGGSSVCMEYSDSMIALLRAQGIPSRAAVGYAQVEDTLPNAGNIPHQWVQIWIPEYGWLSVDPTYESIHMQIGSNIDSILWETFFNENDTNLGIFSANSVNIDTFTKENYIISVFSINESEIPENTSLLKYSEISLAKESNPTVKETVDVIVKTTPAGKAALILLPIVVILVILVILFSVIKILITRTRTQKAPSNQ